MRLHEITDPKFYLFVTDAQSEGEIVTFDGGTKDLSLEIEALLEHNRPPHHPSRSKTFYLAEKPEAADYVYAVRPLADHCRNHMGWVKMLQQTDPAQKGVLASFAHGYWSGEECKEARDEPWEHRASKVMILRRIGRSAFYGAR